MTNIIGHDIDGRPLRVGDEVVVVEARISGNIGQKVKVLRAIGRVNGFAGEERVVIDKALPASNGNKINHARPESLRKLHNDHRPADESFTEMMDKLTSRHGQQLDTKKAYMRPLEKLGGSANV